MRLLVPVLLAVAVMAVPVAAQQGTREYVTLALGGSASGAALGLAAAALAPGDETAEAAAFILAYPLGLALGMSATGHALGIKHSLANTVGDAALGAALGLVVGAGTVYLNFFELGNPNLLDRSPLSIVAVAAYTVTPVALALLDFEVEPVVVRGPEGEQAAALRLQLRF